MADNITMLDANSVSRTIRAIEISSGLWVPMTAIYSLPGVNPNGTGGTSTSNAMLVAARQRATSIALPTNDGDLVNLYTDANGCLRISTQGQLISVQPSGTFDVRATPRTDAIYNGTTVLTPTFFQAEVTGNSSNSQVVAAVTSKKIRVLALSENVGAAQTTVTWLSGSSGTTKSKHAWDSYGGRTLPYNELGWFETASGSGLFMTTAGDTTYVEGVYVAV